VTANAYKGEAVIVLDGTPCILRYDWEGFALLREQLGEAFEVETAQALAKFDLDYVSKVLAVGLRQSRPGITPDEIKRMAPPIGPVAEAISLAYRRAWWGPTGRPAEEPKPNPLKRLLGLISRTMSFSAG
jgi:hypothetical protein